MAVDAAPAPDGNPASASVVETAAPTPAGAHYPALSKPSRPAVVAALAGVLLALVALAAAAALPLFIVGLALAYLIDPGVTWLEARGIPRWLGSVLLIAVLAVILVAFAVIVTTSVATQGTALIAQVPGALNELRAWIERAPLDPAARGIVNDAFAHLDDSLASIDLVGFAISVARPLLGFVDVVAAAFGVPFYVFLVVVDRPVLTESLHRRLPVPWRDDILAVVGIVVRQFGNYLRSEAILMVLLGALTWAGLMLLALIVEPRIASYALFLAVVAAFSELIPLFGPWIAAIPAVLYGLTLGPVPLVAIATLYGIISFTEGNVMVPAIEGRSFALPAAIVAPAIAIGLALGGAFGAVLALPVTSAARDVYLYVFRRSTGLSVENAMDGLGSSASSSASGSGACRRSRPDRTAT
jgi:predicted PurR-regulated permease PerM